MFALRWLPALCLLLACQRSGPSDVPGAGAPPTSDLATKRAPTPHPCRPPGTTPWVPVPPDSPIATSAQIADATGNGDRQLGGFEEDVARRLGALAVGTRCWLGTAVDMRAIRPGRVLQLNGLLLQACGLDCGPAHLGLSATAWRPWFRQGVCATAVGIERRGKGWAVGGALGGVAVRVSGSATPVRRSPLAWDEVVTELFETIGGDVPESCVATWRERAETWKKDLAAGRCPLARLDEHAPLTDYHRKLGPCHGVDWARATLDVLAVRRCDLMRLPAATLRRLVLLYGDGDLGSADSAWLTELRFETAPLRELDAVRTGLVGQALERHGEPDGETRALLANAWAAAPLGVREATLDGLLATAAPLDAKRVKGSLLLALAVRRHGGLATAELAATPPIPPEELAALRRQLAPACPLQPGAKD